MDPTASLVTTGRENSAAKIKSVHQERRERDLLGRKKWWKAGKRSQVGVLGTPLRSCGDLDKIRKALIGLENFWIREFASYFMGVNLKNIASF